MTRNSNWAEIFVQCTYPQVSSSYVYSFVLTNTRTHPPTSKQTDAAEKHPTVFAIRYDAGYNYCWSPFSGHRVYTSCSVSDSTAVVARKRMKTDRCLQTWISTSFRRSDHDWLNLMDTTVGTQCYFFVQLVRHFTNYIRYS